MCSGDADAVSVGVTTTPEDDRLTARPVDDAGMEMLEPMRPHRHRVVLFRSKPAAWRVSRAAGPAAGTKSSGAVGSLTGARSVRRPTSPDGFRRR